MEANPLVAIVKLQQPQSIEESTYMGLAKTLAQLKVLGLLSIIVLDCHLQKQVGTEWLETVNNQMLRLAKAIDTFGEPTTKIVDAALAVDLGKSGLPTPAAEARVFVDEEQLLLDPLQSGNLVILPEYVLSTETSQPTPVNTNEIVLALARHLSGLQYSSRSKTKENDGKTKIMQSTPKASVYRVIVVDPLGGTPAKDRPNGAHVFLNLEEEFGLAHADIASITQSLLQNATSQSGKPPIVEMRQRHRENLDLAKDVLDILPSTSSAIITSPGEAANIGALEHRNLDEAGVFGLVGSVGTRRRQNPLIHNLFTDRPVYSSSLPLGRIKPKGAALESNRGNLPQTTLLKRGMPVTIYPDPRITPWVPPRPGAPRPRLTDNCVDLPRLVHLINDSFNRKLDAHHYLHRVNESLAGIIIAGEYEGGAILTWERPLGLDEETAYSTGRLIPYLDKFAVLKKSQGAGGVADIVFNAMVRDCFPEGVCWRSRKDNPVNKWYFERSRGTWKLEDTNWTMFWTTPWHGVGHKRLWDYEDVCRTVVPSWADKKEIVD